MWKSSMEIHKLTIQIRNAGKEQKIEIEIRKIRQYESKQTRRSELLNWENSRM